MTTSITTRAGKGSPLTHDEVDANFTNLQTTADAALPLAGGTLTGPVTMTGGTVTTSTPLVDATQTWNAAGVTFTGWKLNITNTASANGSKLFDVQYGGLTVVNLTYDASSSYKPVLIVTSAANTNKRLLIDPENQSFAIQYSGSSRASFNDYAVRFCNYAEGIKWSSSGTSCLSSYDTGLHRSAAGIVEINNGTTGTFRDLKLRNLLAVGGNGSYIQTPSMTVANLASAATAGAGARAFVTDATATTFLSTVAGGGSNKVPVVSDGTNWLIG